MTPKPVTMWAVVVKSKRSEWIHWLTIRPNRKQSKEAYFEQWLPDNHAKLEEQFHNGKCRLARVVVAEEGGK